MIQQIDRKDLVFGCVLGLVVGDALGVCANVPKPEGGFESISDIKGGGVFDLKAGEWTGDTSMAMCLAESLLESDGFDADDQMRRYADWFEHGVWSCRDFCFGIEEPMRRALLGNQSSAEFGEGVLGFGGMLARLAPVALFYLQDIESAQIYAAQSVQLTHSHRICVDCARYFTVLLHGALMGVDKERLLSVDYEPEGVDWEKYPLTPEVEALRQGLYRGKPAFALNAPEDALSILEAALWAFAQSLHFKDGALKAVNLGGKASTVGAIYGQFAGAYYGAERMPDNWLRKLVYRDALDALAERLWRATLL